MTLLQVYKRNGSCKPEESKAWRYSEILNEFPFIDNYSLESGFITPKENIKEENSFFSIEMGVAGIDKNKLKVILTKDILTISYDSVKSHKKERFSYREYYFRNFERSFRLPESVDKEKITATICNGILLVNLPKKEESIDKGPRSIDIS